MFKQLDLQVSMYNMLSESLSHEKIKHNCSCTMQWKLAGHVLMHLDMHIHIRKARMLTEYM